MSDLATTVPELLQPGDKIRVVAPSYSLAIISEEVKSIAQARFENELGLEVSFSENAAMRNNLDSSPIATRIDDLHEAFCDPEIKAIFSVIGGYNSNQLLSHINWEIIAENPKVFCGFSDITVLGNAILRKTGLVTFSGPHFSTFGQEVFDQYTADYLKSALFSRRPYAIVPSNEWTDDMWFIDQNDRHPAPQEDYWRLQAGQAAGDIVGGNLCTLNLLQGTEYFPTFHDRPIAFIEDSSLSNRGLFDRDLQSLLQVQKIAGLVIGRFQKNSGIDRECLQEIVASKPELEELPVVANVDFGHTLPMITFPLGGFAELEVTKDNVNLTVSTQ